MKPFKKLVSLLLSAAMLTAFAAGCGREEPEISKTIKWINGTYAVLTEVNKGDYNLIGGMRPTANVKKAVVQMLEASWGVTDRESADETLDWILNEGHRASFESLMLDMDSLGARNMSDDELMEILNEAFDDEDEAEFTAKLYKAYIVKGGGMIDAWDQCRAMSLLGYYYLAGYYTQEESLDKSLEIAKEMQKRFFSWDELMDSYLYGYEYWSSESSDERKLIYEHIKTRSDSPFNLDWNTPLENDWKTEEGSAESGKA